MPNNYTYYGSAGTSASGFTKIFNYRYPYLLVNFYATSDTLYITTDGVTVPNATTPADGTFIINNGQIVTIPNLMPWWTQSASVIPKSSVLGNGPNTGTPYETGNPYGGSLWGTTADPGTVVNFITSTGSHNFEITGIG